MIKDSGNRREFGSGAVRDIQEGKGRCDLLPLEVISIALHNDTVLMNISAYCERGVTVGLYRALKCFRISRHWNAYTMALEVSKHFEEGAKKYGEDNWQKGIPTHCYIDSAIRHYLKWKRGDRDEPHDRAFCWNILCCLWTSYNHPELDDYRKDEP